MNRKSIVVRASAQAILLCILAFGGAARAADSSDAQSLAARAARILHDRCLSCHNEAKHKGGLTLTSREALLKGGGTGPAAIPGDAAASLLALNLLADAEVHMPPDDQLPESEIQTLRDWINASLPWDDAAMKPAAAPPTPNPADLGTLPDSFHPVLALALSPDSKILAAARGSSILLFNVAGEAPLLADTLEGHRDVVGSLAWDTSGTLLASGSFQRIAIHEMTSASEVLCKENAVFTEGIEGRVSALSFSPDGHLLYSADAPTPGKGSARIWNLQDRIATGSWIAHDDAIEAMAVDADGARLFTAGADGLVKMWNVADHSLTRKFEGHTGHVLALALKAGGREVEGGRRLATASADQQVKIWDIETGEQKITIAGHPLAVTALIWPPDATQLVSTCEDGSVRLLNEAKEGPEKGLEAAPEVLYSVAAARDGSKIFAGCHDGLVYCWDKDGKKTASLGPETPRTPQVPPTETASVQAAGSAPPQ